MGKQSEVEKLEQKIEMGVTKHVLVYGVLIWGVTSALIYALLTPLFMGTTFLQSLSFSIWVFPLGGVFYGYFSWLKTKRLLEQLKSQ